MSFTLALATIILSVSTGFQSVRSSRNSLHRRTLPEFCYPTCDPKSFSSSSTLGALSPSQTQLIDIIPTIEIAKTCKVTIGTSPISGRLGLIATSNIKNGETVVALPYDDAYSFTPTLARNIVFRDRLPEAYDGWTGDTGLIALLILNEVARIDQQGGIDKPNRSGNIQKFIQAWVLSLPSPEETRYHPYMWSEEDQENLQLSSTNKIYRRLDDMEEDATWLEERLWSKDRTTFPQTVTWNGRTIPCFSSQGFKWAMILAMSRSFFTDGTLRLMPLLDFANHDDKKGREIEGGTMGTFGTIRGALILAGSSYSAGDEIFISYGPKSAAEYLLDYGFCPPMAWKTAVAELTFELDPNDRFYDDKMDILEFETYDQAPMDPVQSFNVVSQIGLDGEPDQAMVQFVRLCKLGGTDAFLLESIFRKEVWGFMALPVSEQNELQVVSTIIDSCQHALDEINSCPADGPDVCQKLRLAESKALTKTMEFLKREREALDLKEYYQERRLKDLGLDSEWSPESDIIDPELGFGQTRLPGGADYDW